MIDLAGFNYPPDKACIVCKHVMEGSSILAVAHDDDGDLQFACGAEAHTADDWHLVGLEHIDLVQQGLNEMPALHAGHAALRDNVEGGWAIVSIE